MDKYLTLGNVIYYLWRKANYKLIHTQYKYHDTIFFLKLDYPENGLKQLMSNLEGKNGILTYI